VSNRLTIDVSDELFDRLQGVKDKFDVSEVCQDALYIRVKIEEYKQKGGREVGEMIKQISSEMYMAGWMAGIQDCWDKLKIRSKEKADGK
jgi:hypothetical protein